MKLFKNKHTQLPGRRQQPVGNVRTSSTSDDTTYVFSRNRTLTNGTTRSNDINFRSSLHSPRTHVHHLALKRQRLGLVFVIVLGIASFLFLFLMQFTAVVTISVSDTTLSKQVDSDTYIKEVNNYLGIHPFSRLRFVLDQASLKDYLVSVAPEIANVNSISFAGIGETNISLVMRHPVAGWTINNKEYLVDANGIAFEQNYFTPPSVQIVDNSGVALQQGTTLASNTFLGFVGRIVAQSKLHGYIVKKAIIPVGTTRQLEIMIQGVVPYVKLSIDRGAGEQVEDMSRALQYLGAHGQSPSYVDVRVSGKAFYK
jgi:hypothetical protein